MKKFLFFLFFTLPITLFANPITNVRAIQEGKKIVILYDLNEDKYISQVLMKFEKQSRVILNDFLSGDIDKFIKQGKDKRIEYDVLADYVDGLKAENVVFSIFIESEMFAVDLGLSVKWASCNVGATKPEEYGNYYAWGEIKNDKTYYSWTSYKYCIDNNNNLTKYCTYFSYGTKGFTDNKKKLELTDDIANVYCKKDWRMPSIAEFTELMTKCQWEWISENGIQGYKVTGKNGNSIFLPAAGYYNGNKLNSEGVCGRYWSTSLQESSPAYAHYFHFISNYIFTNTCYRYQGLSIRPVCH